MQVITTGGTIASLPSENGDVSAVLSGEELIKKLGITENVRVTSSVTVGSYGFDYATLSKVGQDVIEALKNPDVKGIVITHGTDTIEETAFYLSLITGGYHKPIVLTGAQLDASYAFSDGAKNVQDAITAANADQLNESGVMVVFSGFIFAAREVKKVDTNALEGFGAPGWGPIGRVDKDRVIVNRKDALSANLPPVPPVAVAFIRLGIGMTGDEFVSMTDHYQGVVIEAFGRGNAHPSITEKVKELIDQGIPVIITTRCSQGAVMPIYGNGGGKDLERAGAWFAGDLSGEKARILLGMLLALNKSWEEMENMVQKFSHP